MYSAEFVSGFYHHIQVSYNKEIDKCIIPYPGDYISSPNSKIESDMYDPKLLARVDNGNLHFSHSRIWHPLYPVSKPTLIHQTGIFGKRFEIPFQSQKKGDIASKTYIICRITTLLLH